MSTVSKCLRQKTDIGFEISVYRKPTFTFFSPLKRKISLISTLLYQVLIICTKRRLNEEIERIKKILLYNGYPKNVVNAQIAKKITQFSTPKSFAKKVPCVFEGPLGR